MVGFFLDLFKQGLRWFDALPLYQSVSWLSALPTRQCDCLACVSHPCSLSAVALQLQLLHKQLLSQIRARSGHFQSLTQPAKSSDTIRL
jgi:hypothetical protein